MNVSSLVAESQCQLPRDTSVMSNLCGRLFGLFSYCYLVQDPPDSQSNDWYRGPTKLVQHFAYRGSSHRRKGAAKHIIEMVCFGFIARLHKWGGGGYLTCSNYYYLHSRRL
jgi:hypothetical protein